MSWIKCTDRMPDKNTLVLAWFHNGGYPVWATHYDQEWCAETQYPSHERGNHEQLLR